MAGARLPRRLGGDGRLRADFLDLLTVVNAAEARSSLPAAMRGVRGRPQATKGLDVSIEARADNARRAMQALLSEIRDGSFARQWVHEHRSGRSWFEAARRRDREHGLERVGAQLRGMMPFVRPKVVQADGTVA